MNCIQNRNFHHRFKENSETEDYQTNGFKRAGKESLVTGCKILFIEYLGGNCIASTMTIHSRFNLRTPTSFQFTEVNPGSSFFKVINRF